MSRLRTSPALLVFVAALCVTLGAACDDDSGGGAQVLPKAKNGHHAKASKKDRGIDGEAPRGQFKVGHIDHNLIPESSGVIDSRKHPGVFWTHNDSGNAPLIFAITRQGNLLGQYTLNAHNTDWEAITADDEGHLYIGDTGNNEHRRDRILVYRIDEPDPTAGAGGGAAAEPQTGAVHVNAMWRLDYPGTPFDAESLFLYQGKGYIISKLLTAKPAGLYSFDLADQSDAQTLKHVCDLPIRSPVTDAAISRDGARLAVMTVTGPYLFQIDGDVTAVAKVEPKHQLYFDVKDMNMEGVCFVEGGLLATTEQGQMLFFKDQDFK
jgi:hypothetical protein